MIKHPYSALALLLIICAFCIARIVTIQSNQLLPVKVTTWDALGYYMYLPATFIYKDLKQLSFYDSIEQKYHLQGSGKMYQFNKWKNQNYVGGYMIGTSIIQFPFFFTSHWIAKYKKQADGFSSTYQHGIAWGAIIWVSISLIFLRKFLLIYFPDWVVALTCLIGVLGTNVIQYVAIEGGQIHAWIFPFYVYILITSRKWHVHPGIKNSILLGLVIGLATVCRVTEFIMFVIPLLWNVNKQSISKTIRLNLKHLLIICATIFVCLLPQLIYWKYAAGQWVYPLGSKWEFFNPHWRVLLGEEKGWLIYTPLCGLVIIGLFKMQNFQLKKSMLTFILLNIWIIISWHVWRYGGSYSTRALSHSMPVMMIPMALSIQFLAKNKWKYLFYFVIIFFFLRNFLQLYQYNTGVLHYDRNTWQYYKRIYWKTKTTPEDLQYLQPENED